jgi:NADH-quinone oxidoreductase subunit J
VGIQIFFWIVAAIAILGGLGVITMREPVKSVLSLVVVMIALSGLFLLLSAQFVFIVQLIVYAGAVMVLFLFVVALLGPVRERRTRRLGPFHWVVAVLAGVVFFGLVWSLLSGIPWRTPQQADLNVFGTVEAIGAGLFGPYLYPFELTSILLVVAAVGAIYLSRDSHGPRRASARPQRRAAPPGGSGRPGAEPLTPNGEAEEPAAEGVPPRTAPGEGAEPQPAEKESPRA